MAAMDIQGDLIARLGAALGGTPVAANVPADRPEEFVTVSREGGRRVNGVIDQPGVGIYCWAASEAGACALASKVADAVDSMPFTGGYASARMESMQSDMDLKTRTPRWYLSYTFRTFNPEERGSTWLH